MACTYKKVTNSHHRFAIKFVMTRMIAKGDPNKLTGGPANLKAMIF